MPDLGRWLTPDPLGFADGPNLYAYVHNSPLLNYDAHGLFTLDRAWNTTQRYTRGVGSRLWDGFKGIEHTSRSMGQWMIADSFAEIGDPSLFHSLGQQSCQQWRAFGNELYARPVSTALGCVVPGVMDAWRNPSDPEAWGKATVDVALIALAGAKASSFQRVKGISNIGLREARAGVLSSLDKRIGRFNSLIDLDALSNAGKIHDRGGLTRAGRALEKHGGRVTSVFTKPLGNNYVKNIHGQFQLDSILTDPSSIIAIERHKQFGKVIDIQIPGGRGARFDIHGKMIGFLEP